MLPTDTIWDVATKAWFDLVKEAVPLPHWTLPTVNGHVVAWDKRVWGFLEWGCHVRVRACPLAGGVKVTREAVRALMVAHGVAEERVDQRVDTLLAEAGGFVGLRAVFAETTDVGKWRVMKEISTKAGVRLIPRAEAGRASSNPPAPGRSGGARDWPRKSPKVSEALASATLLSPVTYTGVNGEDYVLDYIKPLEVEDYGGAGAVFMCSNST